MTPHRIEPVGIGPIVRYDHRRDARSDETLPLQVLVTDPDAPLPVNESQACILWKADQVDGRLAVDEAGLTTDARAH